MLWQNGLRVRSHHFVGCWGRHLALRLDLLLWAMGIAVIRQVANRCPVIVQSCNVKPWAFQVQTIRLECLAKSCVNRHTALWRAICTHIYNSRIIWYICLLLFMYIVIYIVFMPRLHQTFTWQSLCWCSWNLKESNELWSTFAHGVEARMQIPKSNASIAGWVACNNEIVNVPDVPKARGKKEIRWELNMECMV